MGGRPPATIALVRPVGAIEIPGGGAASLPAGTEVLLLQELGGSFTVHVADRGLFRIDGRDADALGLAPPAEAPVAAPGRASEPFEEAAVWEALRGCYDPEIPVNIVDLGLVYDLSASPAKGGGRHVEVRMTLTAPGCGMGPAIAADARSRIERVPGVRSAAVRLVWDPPWSAEMMSAEARKKLGFG